MLYCSGCYRLVILKVTSMKIPSYLQYSQSDPHDPPRWQQYSGACEWKLFGIMEQLARCGIELKRSYQRLLVHNGR
jgi:hypothetical protein